MSFFGPYMWIKYNQKNKDSEFDKIVQQAKRAIGKNITSQNTFKDTMLKKINAAITKIDKYLKQRNKTSLTLIFLKAQLFHKKGMINEAKKNYNIVISNTLKIQNKALLAKSYIGMANITNQKTQATIETKIKGENHKIPAEEFEKYINMAIQCLPNHVQLKNIMDQYYWMNEPQKKLADQMLIKLLDNNSNPRSISNANFK